MPVLGSNIADRHFEKPCPRCGEPVTREQELMVTFTEGAFALVHDECWNDFYYGRTGRRPGPSIT